MRAGPGLHCGIGPAAAPHAWRPDPAASARSASAAHQPPHHAGGVQEVRGCWAAWATVMSMQIMSTTAMKHLGDVCSLCQVIEAQDLCGRSLLLADACCRMSCHGQDSCGTLTLLLLLSPHNPAIPDVQDASLSAGWHAGAPCSGADQRHGVAAGRQPQGRQRPAAKGGLA